MQSEGRVLLRESTVGYDSQEGIDFGQLKCSM